MIFSEPSGSRLPLALNAGHAVYFIGFGAMPVLALDVVSAKFLPASAQLCAAKTWKLSMITSRSLQVAFLALFSSFLILIGAGYLMALAYRYVLMIEPHQQMGEGLVTGISDEYHGLPRGQTLL